MSMTFPAGPVMTTSVSGGGVAQKVGADTLLGRIIGLELGAPLGGSPDTERSSFPGRIISVTGRGDGVKADRVGLAVLLAGAWGEIDNNMAGHLSGSLGSDNFLG
jgi:hypothetical protein